MDFLSALKMESYKMLNRNSTRLLVIFCILPLFYGIGNMSKSQAVMIEGQFSAITFGSMCWGLLGLTGVTNVLFAILTVNYFGKEREAGQFKFLAMKICDRKKAIWAKYAAIFLLVILSYILMYMISILVYYSCIAGSEYGSKFMDGFEDLLICFSTDFLYMIQLLMTVSIVVLLCMYYKSSTSLLLGIAVSYTFLVLQYVPLVKFADPIYLVELYNDSQISTAGIIAYGVLYLTICYLVLLFAQRKFEREELK